MTINARAVLASAASSIAGRTMYQHRSIAFCTFCEQVQTLCKHSFCPLRHGLL